MYNNVAINNEHSLAHWSLVIAEYSLATGYFGQEHSCDAKLDECAIFVMIIGEAIAQRQFLTLSVEVVILF